MAFVFHKKAFVIAVALLVIGCALFLLYTTLNPSTPNWTTATVERGDVTEVVSVSGFIEAKNTAQLAFPTTGVVTEVFVDEGDKVSKGQLLATLASTQLVAQRNEALAVLQSANAQYDQLLAGPSTEARSVTEQSLINAQSNLNRVIEVEEAKVAQAREVLLSSSLIALSDDPDEVAQAPSITGTYTCGTEGSYHLSTYASNAYSGYSFQMAGLESGTQPVTGQQQAQLGSCGLYIQFDEDSRYSNSNWTITIPNTASADYALNKSAYDLALKNQENNIKAAEDALSLAQEEAQLANAAPRTEAVIQSQSTIAQAQAKIATIDAQIADRSIVAPFDGVITDVAILSGETATNQPVVTLLASDAFELKARVPEIDITRIAVGQQASVIFDALSSYLSLGEVTYISPLATEIDGVAYFETTISLSQQPEWIRSGLNADIDIVVGTAENTLRIPKRFLITHPDGTYTVTIPNGNTTATTTVIPGFVGNDGYVEITGLSEGDTVVAP